MANRFFNDRRYALEKSVVDIFAQVDVSTSASPVLTASKSKGVASVGYTATGKYTITLSDKYNRLLDAHAQILYSGGTAVNISAITVLSEDVAGAKTVVFQCWAPATTTQAATLLTTGLTGAVLDIHLTLSNSSAL